MWREVTPARLLEAHRVRDSLIARWRLLVMEDGPGKPANEPDGHGMRRFKRYKKEEVRRLNALQASYFSKHVEIFEPPLPEGVPERLDRIVQAAAIDVTDSVLDIGTGTGILLSWIRKYSPARIYASDLSVAMLEFVRAHDPSAVTIQGDVADLALPDGSIGVAFINACYSNIIDKHKTFTNLRRMLGPGGRLIISHPLGRSFVAVLKQNVPFPLDDFPADEDEARGLFEPYGFRVSLFVDEEKLYILRLTADA